MGNDEGQGRPGRPQVSGGSGGRECFAALALQHWPCVVGRCFQLGRLGLFYWTSVLPVVPVFCPGCKCQPLWAYGCLFAC